MIEHLPPDSPWLRGKRGGWSDVEWLLWNVESRLRELISTERTALAAVSAGLHIKGQPTPPEPKYITPPAQMRAENVEDVQARERSELASLVHR